MSVSGNLLDVSVAQVMQFINLGDRTGTLSVTSRGRWAKVGFHRGRIISSKASDSKRLGEYLVDVGALERSIIDQALALQDQERPRRSLGKVLIESGAITEDRLHQLVAQEIQRTVSDVVTWQEGEFEFVLDELEPIDDLGLYPGDILPHIRLDTEMVVLEALQVFDEKNRQLRSEEKTGAGEEPKEQRSTDASPDRPAEAGDGDELLAAPEPASLLEHDATLDDMLSLESFRQDEQAPSPGAELEPAQVSAGPAVRVHLVTDDPTLAENLTSAAAGHAIEVVEVKLRDAGLALPGESPPIAAIDLRSQGLDLEKVSLLRRTRTRSPIITLVDESILPVDAYAAGALAAVPPNPEAVIACVTSVLRTRRGLYGTHSPLEPASGFAKLRLVMADLRSGLLSATVALNLMKVISESVDRAIMYLVRDEELLALGAFGFNSNGTPLATLTRKLRIDLHTDCALVKAVEDGRARSLIFEDTGLPEHFGKLVGRPHTGQVVLFPVIGAERVIGVVYSDNGDLSKEIEEIEILELAAGQVGVALENEMLRREAAQHARALETTESEVDDWARG